MIDTEKPDKGFDDLVRVFLFLAIGSLGVLFVFLVVALITFRFYPKIFYKSPKFKLQKKGKTIFQWSAACTLMSAVFCIVINDRIEVPLILNQTFLLPRAFPFFAIFLQAMIIGGIFWRTGGRLFRSSQGSKIIPLDLNSKLSFDDFKRVDSISRKSQDVPIGISVLDGSVAQYPFMTRNYHMMVVGGSGFGKTTLMKTLFANAIYRKQPVIMIDPKGSSNNLNEIRKFALEHGVPADRFFVFSLPNPEASCFYNPIKNADTTAKKDRIMEAFNWSEQFYQSRASDYLTILMPILELFKLGDVTLGDVRRSLTDDDFLAHMKKIFSEIATAPGVEYEFKERCNHASKQIELLEKFDGAEGLKSQLVTLEQSDYGYLFSPEKDGDSDLGELWKDKRISKQTLGKSEEVKLSEKGLRLQSVLKDASFLKKRSKQMDYREIDLSDVVENGGFVYFQISMMQTPDTARRIARVVLEDLKGVANRIQTHKLKRPSLCPVFIDEFGEFATEEFGVFLEQVRDAGLALHLFFQSFGNLEAVSPTFRKRMEASTAEKIFLSSLSPEDADNAASLCGTDDAVEQSRQTVGILGWSIPTGMGNQRFTKQMRVEHDVFKRLGIGQAVTLRKFPESKVDLVQIWNPDLTNTEQRESSFDQINRKRATVDQKKKLATVGRGNFNGLRSWQV